MARLDGHLFNKANGSVVEVIVYNMYGKSYMRSKPSQYKDRKSAAQLEQRMKMTVVNNFLKPFTKLFPVTFAASAVGKTAYHAAKSYNLTNGVCGGFPNLEVDYGNALLSKGNVDLPRQVRATLQAEGILLEWDFNSREK